MIYTHPDPVTPVQCPDPVVEEVREKLRVRSEAGIRKYGCTMERPDLTEIQWLNHALEEALDLAIYLQRLIRDKS